MGGRQAAGAARLNALADRVGVQGAATRWARRWSASALSRPGSQAMVPPSTVVWLRVSRSCWAVQVTCAAASCGAGWCGQTGRVRGEQALAHGVGQVRFDVKDGTSSPRCAALVTVGIETLAFVATTTAVSRSCVRRGLHSARHCG